MPHFRRSPSHRRAPSPTAKWLETPVLQVNFGAHRSARRRVNAPGHGTEGMSSMQDQLTLGYGLCECGCGRETFVPPYNNRSKGWVKGQPLRYARGHHHGASSETPAWIEEDRGYGTPCWIWQRAMYASGYGAMKFNRTMHNAHRGVYLKFCGPIPDDLVLDHLCRVRACVNPDHMEIVSTAENCRRGEQTRLTAAAAEAIRASDEDAAVLAERYGVTRSHIYHIRDGRKWSAA